MGVDRGVTHSLRARVLAAGNVLLALLVDQLASTGTENGDCIQLV